MELPVQFDNINHRIVDELKEKLRRSVVMSDAPS